MSDWLSDKFTPEGWERETGPDFDCYIESDAERRSHHHFCDTRLSGADPSGRHDCYCGEWFHEEVDCNRQTMYPCPEHFAGGQGVRHSPGRQHEHYCYWRFRPSVDRSPYGCLHRGSGRFCGPWTHEDADCKEREDFPCGNHR